MGIVSLLVEKQMSMRRPYAQAPIQFVKSKIISSDYPTFEIKGNEDELLIAMHFVEKLFPDRAIIVCQRTQAPRVQYASENCRKVFGHDNGSIKKMLLPDFLTLVHPEDIENVHQCFSFINDYEPYDPLQYRFELRYRIQHKSGEYIHISDEKVAVKSRGGKYIYLNLFKDVTAEERFHDVKLTVFQTLRDDLRKIYTYVPRLNADPVTPRQKDVANLIKKGFSNQDIADLLSLSINTVKNHKTLLFKKFNVKSSVELASIAHDLNG